MSVSAGLVWDVTWDCGHRPTTTKPTSLSHIWTASRSSFTSSATEDRRQQIAKLRLTHSIKSHKSHKIVQNSTKFVISKMLTGPKWSKFLIVKTNMFWTIKTLFCLVMLRWLTRLSAYIISGRYETMKIINNIDSNKNNVVPEGRVYNPDVSRHAVTDFISGDNKQEDNWTLS